MGGLALMNALPTQDSQMESLRRALHEKNQELAGLRDELRVECQKTASMERGIAELRRVLTPLYRGLVHIFGEIEVMGVEAEQSSGKPKNSAVWESWKQKLGGKTGEAIDVLLLHGEMNAQQLRIHLKCGNEYVYKVITKLANANLINRNGPRISLKEL